MRKILFSTLLVTLFGASSALAWGHPYLNNTQNYKNYLNCVNTAKNGTERQQILANTYCETIYGVTTHNPG